MHSDTKPKPSTVTHTCIHTLAHTHAHAHTHTCTHTLFWSLSFSFSLSLSHTHKHTHALVQRVRQYKQDKHACTQTKRKLSTVTHTCIYVYSHTHTHKHTIATIKTTQSRQISCRPSRERSDNKNKTNMHALRHEAQVLTRDTYMYLCTHTHIHTNTLLRQVRQ